MANGNKMSFDRATIDRAKRDEKALFLCGYRYKGGGIESSGPVDPKLAHKITMFAMSAMMGKQTPQEAFEKAFK